MRIRIFRHFGLKVASVILAALIWLIVSGEEVVERAFRIPLEFTNLPAELELASDAPSVVDVRVRGSSGALSRLSPGELVAVLDLRSARPGQRLFHVSGTDVRSPFGVDVVQVSPSSMAMTFEPSALKEVPIAPVVEGDPARGFKVGPVIASPGTVLIAGPATAVRATTEAITEPVSVAGASKDVVEMVNVGVADPSVRLRSTTSTQVKVTITSAR